jgi:hypothetical protein
MLAQQRTIAQLIELLNHVRQLLMDDKHEKEASQAAFTAHAEEEQRLFQAKQDRCDSHMPGIILNGNLLLSTTFNRGCGSNSCTTTHVLLLPCCDGHLIFSQ